MKFMVYDGVEPEQKTVRLRLVDLDGFIELRAVDELGVRLRQGGLLTFYQGGRVARLSSIDPGLGLNLDSAGKMIIE